MPNISGFIIPMFMLDTGGGPVGVETQQSVVQELDGTG